MWSLHGHVLIQARAYYCLALDGDPIGAPGGGPWWSAVLTSDGQRVRFCGRHGPFLMFHLFNANIRLCGKDHYLSKIWLFISKIEICVSDSSIISSSRMKFQHFISVYWPPNVFVQLMFLNGFVHPHFSMNAARRSSVASLSATSCTSCTLGAWHGVLPRQRDFCVQTWKNDGFYTLI